MQTRTVEQVESWNARPFSGSFRELHDLADDEFSGAVVADDTWAFFLNGRVVGVFQGDIDDFDDASGTVYTAPDPALPLLFSMQERGGSTQAKYFTEDTSVESADSTLRDANFTGFLELSENVLSGDYYVAYYGGRSMSAAFIGQNERLVTGEEAFERANDEVGVFEVRKVSMTITEIPSPAEPEPSDDVSGAVETDSEESDTPATGTGKSATSSAEAEGRAGGTPSEEASEADAGEEPTETDPVTFQEAEPDRSGEDESDTTTAGDTGAAAGAESARPPADDPDASSPPSDSSAPSKGDDESPAKSPSPSDADAPRDQEPSQDTASVDDSAPESDDRTAHEKAVAEWAKQDREDRSDSTDQDLFREEAQWRETNTIPALDPDECESGETDSATTPARGSGGETTSESPSSRESAKRETDSRDVTDSRDAGARGGSARERSASGSAESPSRSAGSESAEGGARQGRDPGADVAKLERAVAARDERIESLESELQSAESERDELRQTVSDLKSERDELERRISDLEDDLASAAPSSEDAPVTTDLSPSEALAGTNLFVRYDSKGQPTLDAIDDAGVDHQEIVENLRLDHHTQFDASTATVDGTAFEAFLRESARFRFVRWLVEDLPTELADSGAKAVLRDVYDAVPEFDRVEFDGTVEVQNGGESSRHQFQIVVRNRMGEPLVVADTEPSREAVRGAEMDDLITRATAVANGADSLAGAFYVTASFFEPDALERAQEAADEGGFFSRSDRESYVKTSRKQGYHLCLIEDRSDTFHLTVPEI
ncbi:MAG: hypothetical protein ABEJ55_06585 [Halanaeroarchaeum sp.]